MPDQNPSAEANPGVDPGHLYGRWYYSTYTVPYDENAHWAAFFGQVADNIVRQLAPGTVLDAGCAKGFLVKALREREVDANGVDLSSVAVDDAPKDVQPYLRVGSLTDPIEGHYDLVTCIEVIEHLDPVDAPSAIANLCGITDTILLSTTPGDQGEATHVNVQPPERWSQMFATHGFFRDFHHNADYLSPWAALYRRSSPTVPELVLDYDRAWYQLRQETVEQRRALLGMQDQIEASGKADARSNTEVAAENEQLHKEVLKLRDHVIGKEAELATALGRTAELEAYVQRYEPLQHVLASRSWRLSQKLTAPLRKVRERRARRATP